MVDSLGRSLEALDNKLKPKKKFAFSNKSKKEVIATNSSLPAIINSTSGIVIDSSKETKAEIDAVNTSLQTTSTISSGEETMIEFLPPGAYVVSNRTDDQHILLDAEFFQEHVLKQIHDQSTRVQLFIKNNSNCIIIV